MTGKKTVDWASMTTKAVGPIEPNACAIREFTADGISVGRCWFALEDGNCPRHGDVREVQQRYIETGKLTDEPKSLRRTT